MPASPAPVASAAAASMPLLSDEELLDVLSQIDESVASLSPALVADGKQQPQQQSSPLQVQVSATA